MRLELLIIDPQIDFCDPQTGALYVPGAEQDMARLAAMVRRLAPQIDAIHVTLDSHHLVHIAHPLFWRDAQGQPPAPFTLIRAADVETGRWTPTQPAWADRALAYVQALEQRGRYVLCIWPPHCLIGSVGHAVMPALFAALSAWEEGLAVVDYVQKGSNLFTEHYSALQAEVPDPTDPGAQLNTALLQALTQADLVAVAGEAGSHCVANTVRDIADHCGDPSFVRKLVLLTDAVSPVTGFESFQLDFVQEMTARGMQTSTTTEFLAP